MRLSAKTFAAMLMGLALAAFQFDLDAQSRGGSRSSSSSRSSSVSRSSSNSSRSSSSSSRSSSSTSRSSSSSRPSVSSNKPSGQPANTTASRQQDKKSNPAVSRPSTGSPSGQPAASSTRPDNAAKPDISPADRNPSRPSGNKPSAKPDNKPSAKPDNKPSAKPGNKPSARPDNKPAVRPDKKPRPDHKPKPGFKPGNQHKPISVRPPKSHPRPDRIHPRHRDFMHYSKPSYHWAPTPHYYGYRVRTLPINVVRRIFGGITYYYYDNIWYRPYDGYYVVCRPPFGTSLAASLITDIAWTSVQLSYYNTVANTYRQINENDQYIAQQNAIIAQNNATIAAQNQAIAQSQTKAQAAYSLANQLGLIQSYAAADASYFYQDGVFYSQSADGQYYVIVPPVGALVETLPEDFDTVILDGKEYYRVDDTIYMMTINDGKPYFEVIGQIN